MELKQPLSFHQQVEMLHAHGYRVEDIDTAIATLERISYYRLTGYALQFRKDPDNSDVWPGTEFDTVCRLCDFDARLRSFLRYYLEVVEIYYRTIIAYGFSMSKCLDAPHDQHYDRGNYYNKAGFDNIISSFSKQKDYYRDSLIVKHHSQKYNSKMSLWVVVELLSFSNLSKLYSCMYYTEKDAIADLVGVSRNTLENHLHCMSVLRNRCAHGARLYNAVLNPPVKFNSAFLRRHSDVQQNSLFAYIVILLKRLPESTARVSLIEDIHRIIEEYHDVIDLSLMGFPAHYMDILSKYK